MDVYVIGAGAMGSLFAALLHRSGVNVVLVDRDPDTVKAIATRGVRVEGVEEFTASIPIYGEPPPGRPWLVVLLTKSYSTREALASAASVIGRDTVVMSLQNGLGNEEEALKYTRRVVGGITTNAAIRKAPGRIRWAGRGITVIGRYPRGSEDAVERIARLLREAGLEVEVTSNSIGWKWVKAIVNAAINPIGALVRAENGYILEDPGLLELALEVAGEASHVANTLGVELPRDPESLLLDTLKRTRENLNSMLQDLMACRRTEVDYINGRIALLAEEHGVKASLNKALWTLVKAAEARCGSDAFKDAAAS